MPVLNGCGLSGSMRSAAGGEAAGEGVIPGVNCGETRQLGEPDGRDGDQRMEPKIAVAAATPRTVLTIIPFDAEKVVSPASWSSCISQYGDHYGS
ncbi:unnamed protein product [Urochloa humidicola]